MRVASWSRKPVMSSVANNTCCSSAAAELDSDEAGTTLSASDPSVLAEEV
jgi:hypothetical protein